MAKLKTGVPEILKKREVFPEGLAKEKGFPKSESLDKFERFGSDIFNYFLQVFIVFDV